MFRYVRQTYKDVTRFRESQSDPELLLNRLWVTSHRNTKEDIVVDSCIAMETLVKTYLIGKGNEQVSSKDIAIHIAYLLSKNSEGRKRVFDIVRKGFSLRNKIVHGQRMRVETYDPLWRFFPVLRHSIREIVRRSPNISKRKIEDYIL